MRFGPYKQSFVSEMLAEAHGRSKIERGYFRFLRSNKKSPHRRVWTVGRYQQTACVSGSICESYRNLSVICRICDVRDSLSPTDVESRRQPTKLVTAEMAKLVRLDFTNELASTNLTVNERKWPAKDCASPWCRLGT
jgi:hypothetical protein